MEQLIISLLDHTTIKTIPVEDRIIRAFYIYRGKSSPRTERVIWNEILLKGLRTELSEEEAPELYGKEVSK